MKLSTHVFKRWSPLLGCVLLFSSVANAQTTPAPWQYDLRQGDHLIYRYTFEREVSGADFQTHTKATFTSHVLVLGQLEGHLSVGFQRNRETAQLLVFRQKGKDKLAQELPGFEQRMAKRPSRFYEANEITTRGTALYYWQAARESQSKLLLALHEIESLPEKSVSVGDTWKSSNILGLDFHFAAQETLSGKQCARVEGSNASDHLRYWWCPEMGVLAKIEFDGEYTVLGNATAHEKLSFELKDQRRGETIMDWLKSQDTQRAALQALLASRWVPISSDALIPLLQSGDPEVQTWEVQALALAVIYQRGLETPSRDVLTKLANSQSAEVKRIAARMLDPAPPSRLPTVQGCPLPPLTHYSAQKPDTSPRTMQSGPFKSQPYMLHVPKDYRGDQPFPLLIYLSGGPGLAMDGVNTAEDVTAPTGYLVLYPQAGDLWWQPDITARFSALLQEVLQNLNVDTNRVYITGFSNGGTGAVYYATRWPQRFAAVVSLMGEGDCLPDTAATLPNLTNLPLLFVHGDKDAVIPSSCSSQTYEDLRNLSPGALPQIQILKNREHNVTLQEDDGLTLPFFADKVRNPFPRKISARFSDMLYPRHYWVELLEKGAGVAEIEGRIKPDNTVELTTRNVKRLRLLLRPELFASPGPIRILMNRKEVFRGELKRDCRVLAQTADALADPFLGYSNSMDFTVGK